MFGKTEMAGLMAAGGGDVRQETATHDPAEVIDLSTLRNESPQVAAAQG
jgi:hypothetical protein